MAQEVKVPDIGNYSNIPVIEILVKPGETVKKDQGLVTLESDKATMEVPAPFAGVVAEIKVKVGDEVSEGVVVVLIAAADGAAKPAAAAAPAPGLRPWPLRALRPSRALRPAPERLPRPAWPRLRRRRSTRRRRLRRLRRRP